MAKEVIEAEGVVKECLPNTTFRVLVTFAEGVETEVLATASGKIKMHYIRIIPGDRVSLEMSPYDLTKARIMYRYKDGETSPKKQ